VCLKDKKKKTYIIFNIKKKTNIYFIICCFPKFSVAGT